MFMGKLKILIISFIFIILICIPFVIQGNKYYVGGDDTRLYYIFPDKYLDNLAFNIISDNTLGGANTGYYPTSQFAPFLYFLVFLKKVIPFINTQNLMYGMNYAFAFIFFFLLLGFWVKKNDRLHFSIKLIGSLFYVFSPLLIRTLYTHQLISIYLISLMPAMLFFFFKAIDKKRPIYSVISSLIFTVFSTTINTIPWTIPIFPAGKIFISPSK